jgi:hypothetical protein
MKVSLALGFDGAASSVPSRVPLQQLLFDRCARHPLHRRDHQFESGFLQQTVRLSLDFSFLYEKAGSCRGVRGLGQAAQPTETRSAREHYANCR